jgi:multidrug efflux pump subunit AcrA (membrane-fusion protein)
MFVTAEIEGRRYDDVVVIPRSALLAGERVLVVDDDDRLRSRPVEILRRERDAVVVRRGLAAGARVCLSPPPVWTEGMRVQIAPPAAAAPAEAAAELPAAK